MFVDKALLVAPPSSQDVPCGAEPKRDELSSPGSWAKDACAGGASERSAEGSSASSSSNIPGVASFNLPRFAFAAASFFGVDPPPTGDRGAPRGRSAALKRPEEAREPQRLTSAMSSSKFSCPAEAESVGRCVRDCTEDMQPQTEREEADEETGSKRGGS